MRVADTLRFVLTLFWQVIRAELSNGGARHASASFAAGAECILEAANELVRRTAET